MSLAAEYMIAFHWVLALFSPVPFPHVPQSEAEQIFILLAIIVGLPIIGSFLSRLTGLVTAMNAKATETKRKLQHLEQYLMVNKFPVELSARVSRFLEHKFKQTNAKVPVPESLALLPTG